MTQKMRLEARSRARHPRNVDLAKRVVQVSNIQQNAPAGSLNEGDHPEYGVPAGMVDKVIMTGYTVGVSLLKAAGLADIDDGEVETVGQIIGNGEAYGSGTYESTDHDLNSGALLGEQVCAAPTMELISSMPSHPSKGRRFWDDPLATDMANRPPEDLLDERPSTEYAKAD